MSNLRIKNMVCPRCILVVQEILHDLGQEFIAVEMGLVRLERPLRKIEYDRLEGRFKAVGFEMITTEADYFAAEIKYALTKLVITQSYKKINISVYLSEQLARSYTYLSRSFTKVEGSTIQEFWLNLKIEKAKEMLRDDKYSICEVSETLGYTSNSHFTVQFKKITNKTPKEYRASL